MAVPALFRLTYWEGKALRVALRLRVGLVSMAGAVGLAHRLFPPLSLAVDLDMPQAEAEPEEASTHPMFESTDPMAGLLGCTPLLPVEMLGQGMGEMLEMARMLLPLNDFVDKAEAVAPDTLLEQEELGQRAGSLAEAVDPEEGAPLSVEQEVMEPMGESL